MTCVFVRVSHGKIKWWVKACPEQEQHNFMAWVCRLNKMEKSRWPLSFFLVFSAADLRKLPSLAMPSLPWWNISPASGDKINLCFLQLLLLGYLVKIQKKYYYKNSLPAWVNRVVVEIFRQYFWELSHESYISSQYQVILFLLWLRNLMFFFSCTCVFWSLIIWNYHHIVTRSG